MASTGDFLVKFEHLLKENIDIKHSAYFDGSLFSPFNPTKFVYMFSLFNTLYSIDWDKSILTGEAHYESIRVGECGKIRNLLWYCYSDDQFNETQRESFISNMLKEYQYDLLVRDISKFSVDTSPLGAFYKDNATKDKLLKKIKSIVVHQNFTKYNVYDIVRIIYDVRCNMFHGVKGLCELENEDQSRRFLFYTNMLYAVIIFCVESLTYRSQMKNS